MLDSLSDWDHYFVWGCTWRGSTSVRMKDNPVNQGITTLMRKPPRAAMHNNKKIKDIYANSVVPPSHVVCSSTVGVLEETDRQQHLIRRRLRSKRGEEISSFMVVVRVNQSRALRELVSAHLTGWLGISSSQHVYIYLDKSPLCLGNLRLSVSALTAVTESGDIAHPNQ